MELPVNLLTQAQQVKLIVFDVDGVLTDGQLWYSSSGDELKAFNVQDGSAIKMLQQHGIEVAFITGRDSPMVTRRAEELGVRHLYQGSERSTAKIASNQQSAPVSAARGKEPHYIHLLEKLGLADSQVACVGDDLADIALLKRCGLGISVPNGHPAAKQVAQHITNSAGGHGVARELAELLLRAQNKWPY